MPDEFEMLKLYVWWFSTGAVVVPFDVSLAFDVELRRSELNADIR